ncbi:MAG: peptide-methionine (S)-S-oxide reductase MsrA [Chthonomonadaceae bacterium]|nr:peptide-methionine (S)-S-oxide reductase MsrA [Chthonomonadaceae bacterium]
MNNTKSFVVAGGCFWCVEAIYEELKGVISVESGYAGGKIENPTYSQVCSGLTGHAEAVKVTFDPAVVSESDLLHLFFTTHDPTTLNKQGGDVGTQYRSAIFYKDEAEKSLAESVIKEIERDKIWSKPIVTTLEPLTTFYPAEDYHQDYFKKFEKATPQERLNMNAGYCSAVIEPKVAKFRTKYRDKLKK